MKYYKDQNTNEVFGFDENDETQLPYMQQKVDAGCVDITGSWPPPTPTEEPVIDPIQKLKTFLSENPDVLSHLNLNG